MSLAKPITDRDLQRRALHDLIALATDCASSDQQIEQTRSATVESIRQASEKSDWIRDERTKAQSEAIHEKHQTHLKEVTDRFASDKARLDQHDRHARQRVEAEYDQVASDTKKRLQQAVWLADSVYEAASNQIRDEYKKAAAKVKEEKDQLAALEGESIRTLLNFGQQPQDYPALPPAELPEVADADAAYTDQFELAKAQLAQFKALSLPKVFVGAWPILIVIAVLGGVVILTGQVFGKQPPAWMQLGSLDPSISAPIVTGGIALILLIVAGVLLRILALRQIKAIYLPLMHTQAVAAQLTDLQMDRAESRKTERKAAASNTRNVEAQAAADQFNPILARAAQKRDAALQITTAEHQGKLRKLTEHRDKHTLELSQWLKQQLESLGIRSGQDQQSTVEKQNAAREQAEQMYLQSRCELEQRWKDGLTAIQSSGAATRPDDAVVDFTQVDWNTWKPPREFSKTVPFGLLKVDLRELVAEVMPVENFRLELPQSFEVPAMLAFPEQASLMIEFDRAGREKSLRTLQLLMARLLTNLPAGRVRFTIIDPVGLGQNFAGFMHLADYDEALVGGRIWTDADHIEQRLADLTEHMETVIQKYLRNEFATIDDYNAQAGELAEPYRFLVIADFPVNFSEEAMKRLASIASTGARCGVYTLIARDLRTPLPQGAHLEDIAARGVHLILKNDSLSWEDEVFKRFPLTLDTPPDEQTLTRMLHVVGTYAKDANRVEVPFETIAPETDKIWSGDCTNELRVPIGRVGATRQQFLRLGKGVAQHSLIAGKTGSGKSTLLHVLATNLALWYSPDQVEMYLIDFKKGVEFKTYATNLLPHARAIAVESDREFGLSVLQRLDAELTRRGELFRSLGVQDLAAYRATPDAQPMPRTLLIIDEFQEFFSEDDKLAQDASALIDRLVRQGRAFGIHVLLGSQTISGSGGLPRSTLGQMAVRVALQCSEADSHLILGDNNAAARLLSRPGEAIYNDVGGLVEGNSPFQISWLADETRDRLLAMVRQRYETQDGKLEPIVFEGNAPADIRKNVALTGLLNGEAPAGASALPTIWFGEPVAIRPSTHAVLRRQSGANVLIVGQHDQTALALMAMAILSLGVQQESGSFYLLDGTPADSPHSGRLPEVLETLSQTVHNVDYRAVPQIMDDLAKELQRRQAADDTAGAPIFLFIHGVQRYRALRKSEDSFSFSSGDEEKPPATDKQFADILREGPNFGIHVIAWADTAATLDRTFDRNAMRDFDYRVLMQMSATDSSNLMDSPAANKMGMFRALLYSEEQGVMEKFRPYAFPDAGWLDQIRAKSRR